jgi:hypothetical protein
MDNLNIHRRKSLTDLLGDEIGTDVWNRFTSITRPNTAAGSIRQKSKSDSSHGNA